MASTYTLNTFLRQTPKPLLKRYFREQSLLNDCLFDGLGRTNYQPILESMTDLTRVQRAQVERDFQDIFLLANKSGMQIMLDESILRGADLSDMLARMENHYHRAMWLFLEHNTIEGDLFSTCVVLAHMKTLRFSRSKRLTNLPKRPPQFEPDDLMKMADAISHFYQSEGRGYRCIVEHYERINPERHCFFAYPEDYTTSELGYTEGEGELHRQARRSVFQVAFIYRLDEGTLELSAPGGQREARLLQEIFCRYVLGMDGLPVNSSNRAYDLSGLKRRSFRFPTDPTDRIQTVEVLGLRLSSPYQRRRRVMVEHASGTDETLHDWMDEILNRQKIPLEMLDVSWAKFKITWLAEPRHRPKTLTFTVSVPDTSSLKDLPQHQLMKRYLKTWKISQ